MHGFVKVAGWVVLVYASLCGLRYFNIKIVSEYVDEKVSSARKTGAVASEIDWNTNLERQRAVFHENSHFIFEKNFLPAGLSQALLAEVAPLRHLVYRNGGFALAKQGGSFSLFQLLEHCPKIVELYNSPQLLDYVRKMTGIPGMTISPSFDPHAAAVYWYDAEFDHVNWHFDSSWFSGERYTMLLPLLDKSTQKLEARYQSRTTGETLEASISTVPESMILFWGDKIQHRVTNMGKNETRIVLTLEFVTASDISPSNFFLYYAANAGGYFGFPIDIKLVFMVLVLAIYSIAGYLLLWIAHLFGYRPAKLMLFSSSASCSSSRPASTRGRAEPLDAGR